MAFVKTVALYATLAFFLFCGVAVAAEAAKETQEFQTDVRKMLDIIINSLYTNRNIFLRELISNASDAIDKIRFQYLTSPNDPKTADGESVEFEIRIFADKEARTLTIRDGGVGMNRDDLRNHLGSLGTSGTKNFVEAMTDNKDADMSLIGQFGVGFYSAFLVADKVVVASKKDGEPTQWVWESDASGEFSTYEDVRGNTLGRGTEITLHLKEDADEFLDDTKVRDIASRYSEFINFPIYVRERKTAPGLDIPMPEREGASEDEKYTWTHVNQQKPIWTRSASDLTEEDYNKFYTAISKMSSEPLMYSHFSAEGEVEFKSILFVPSHAPQQMFESASAAMGSIKLYVRRVFITDEFKDMLPRYLSFIKGVVDSDDLPLNVSRELLQESRVLKIIKKKLVRKALSMLKELADEDDTLMEQWREANADKDPEDREDKPTLKYAKFWNEFGKAIRLGLIEDTSNRSRLSKLLRYRSSAVDADDYRSLEQYVEAMPENQKDIYFIIGAGEDVEKLMKKPHLQRARALGVEVLLMNEAIDEYVVGHMTEFASKKLVNLAKDDARLPGEDVEEKNLEKAKLYHEDFLKWYEGVLSKRVEKVTLSARLVESPAIVVAPRYGITAGMQQIMKGTPLSEQGGRQQEAKKILELNIRHPLIDAIREKALETPDDETLRESAVLLFETAAFDGGYELDDVSEFVSRMQGSVAKTMGVTTSELLPPEEYPEEDLEDEEDEPEEEGDAEEPIVEDL